MTAQKQNTLQSGRHVICILVVLDVLPLFKDIANHKNVPQFLGTQPLRNTFGDTEPLFNTVYP